ncbi:metal ABC transporter permease [Savagea sp. SN6]|uniref:Manganese transport system membrane protein MntC n=1 Tax=Savagea serpentis TaxID=2785297 RepID=A0A8J7KGG7_9BACL|nr:metal ABC transporter permease [Savagea serpentis]MBF4499768.1 metal ABC transporter permease [Savagea serpentis]
MSFIQDIQNYEFLQKALFTAIIVGIISGVLGSFIILRGMSLMGDAISHAVLPGVAISYMLGISYFYGAVVFGLMTAFGIGFITQNSRIKNDTSIGIVFSAFFAVGIILIGKANTSTDLTSILFGNVLAVRDSDMWITLGVGIFVLSIIALFFKEFLISTFDPTLAASFGLSNKWIHYGLMVLLTLVTVASLQTVGIILVVAMLITPAATAYLLTNRLSHMIFISSVLGAVSATIGLYISFIYNWPSGAAIVLVTTAFFVTALLFSPKHGIVWRTLKVRKNKTAVGQ